MRYFRCDSLSTFSLGTQVQLAPEESMHAFKILRMHKGDRLGLLDGGGHIAIAEITDFQQVKILSCQTVPVPQRRIHLFFAPPRKQKLDVLLKQAVELGVWELIPVQCERSVVEPHSKSVDGRWQSLLFESCKQSVNPFFPKISHLTSFRDAVSIGEKSCSLCITGSPRECSCISLKEHSDIGYFVGPEGGFSEEEEKIMQEHHFRTLRIGQWILRVETAVTAGLAVLNALP